MKSKTPLRSNLFLAFGILIITLQGCSTAGSKGYSHSKIDSLIVGMTTMEEAKKRLGKPFHTYLYDANQARQFVHTKTHRLLPTRYLPTGEYSVWYYFKVRARPYLGNKKNDGILIFDSLGRLVKIEKGSEE